MDFPVCPSCGQSVIDDDAADCPFCGSSMKAKPGAKPAKAAAAAPAKSGAMQTKPGSSAKLTAAKSDADDFPFDTEIPGARTAVQAMPGMSKGRSLKVVCPMCETTGYVPPTAAGKEVKCANTNCLVPIFKAPVAVAEEAPPPPPPRKSNLLVIGGATALVMIVGGGVAVFLAMQPSNGSTRAPGGVSDDIKKLLEEERNSKQIVVTKPKEPVNPLGMDVKKAENPNQDDSPKDTDDFIKRSLKQMNDCSLIAEGKRQRSKPYCRQLAAEACAIAGETTSADSHLSQLIVVGPTVPYFRIEPDLELFWRAWKAGQKNSATKLVSAALEDSKNLPITGRHQLEVAGRLAAALAVAGRIPDGLKLLEEHQSADLKGQLAARVQMSTAGKVARLTSVRTVLPWNYPQSVAATETLITRGQLAAARSWADAQPNEDAQTECLAIWAEYAARQMTKPGSADLNPDIVSAAKTLDPALAARVWARAACGRFAAGDQSGAAATLKIALQVLNSAPVPVEQQMPEIKATTKAEVPSSVPLVHGATAASEIAFAYTLWPDGKQDAESALELALQFAQGLAPGLPAVTQRISEADQVGAAGLRDMLKKQMMLKSDDLARQAVGNYRRKLGELKTAAAQRFSLQVNILSRLAESGLKDKVWTIVSDRSVDPNPSRRDSFTETQLLSELLELFHGTETGKAIAGAVPSGVTPERPVFETVRDLLKASNTEEASAYVSGLDGNTGARDDIALTFATHLAATGKAEAAFAFVARLTDGVLREEAYRLVAALAAQRGQTALAWKQVALVNEATEKVSICRGIVGGLKAGAPETDLPERRFEP